MAAEQARPDTATGEQVYSKPACAAERAHPEAATVVERTTRHRADDEARPSSSVAYQASRSNRDSQTIRNRTNSNKTRRRPHF